MPSDAVPRLVLGTAGHIDHGKTALVRALTGVDCDRLPEEKARGITIDLGFAPLDLPGGLRVGVVDVPGHERLVRTMVSGATGIDLVLLVVAADEGVMPQTREHVAVCDLLGVGRGVVAVTKIDAVDAETAGLAEAEVAELLAPTSLAGAPRVRVSARTADGIERLRAALAEQIGRAAARTPRAGPPRLPVDRAFAMKGFGTVVTGTLLGAPLRAGDKVSVYPGGRRARVRGLERHGVGADAIEPGARCAVNLQGVAAAELERGFVVSAPGALAPARAFDARVRCLEGAPPARDGAPVLVLAGTAERLARIRWIGPMGGSAAAGSAGRARAGGPAGAVPGASGYARLHLEGEPLPLLPGDRFILRGFARTAAGGATLGGGVVLDVAPPRRRRSDPQLRADLDALARGRPEQAVWVRVRRAGLSGITADALRRETGLFADELAGLLGALERAGRAAPTPAGRWLARPALADLEARVLAALDAFHAREPLRPGMPHGALRGALPANVDASAVDLVVTTLERDGRVAVERNLVRRAEHRAALGADDERMAARILEGARAAGLEPPSLREWCERLGAPPGRVRELLAHLEREGRLVRAPGGLHFDRAAIDALRARVMEHLRAHGELGTPAYKALIGAARRSAVPLMELFDEEKLTLRRGNARVLRGG